MVKIHENLAINPHLTVLSQPVRQLSPTQFSQQDTLAGDVRSSSCVTRFIYAVLSKLKQLISFLTFGYCCKANTIQPHIAAPVASPVDPFKDKVMEEGKHAIELVKAQLKQVEVEKVVLFSVSRDKEGKEQRLVGYFSPKEIEEAMEDRVSKFADGGPFQFLKVSAFLVHPEMLSDHLITEVSFQVLATEKGVEAKQKVVEDVLFEDFELADKEYVNETLGPIAVERLS